MARELKRAAKRANRPNPREDRNLPNFLTHGRYAEDQDNVVAIERARTFRTSKYQQHDDPNQMQIRAMKRVVLIPRNLAQEAYIEALNDDSKCIVFAMGPAGTGKTMLATQFAVRQLQEGMIDRIIVTRPQVSVDEQMGFLPGTLIDKMAPWCIPILDTLKETFPVPVLKKMIENEVIEFAPLGFMRGRTLKNSVVIFDESQNATPNQMKMMLTRIGSGCRMIVTGDIRQHDRGFDENGLKDFTYRLAERRSDRIAVVQFDARDVERHPVIEEVLAIYD